MKLFHLNIKGENETNYSTIYLIYMSLDLLAGLKIYV